MSTATYAAVRACTLALMAGAILHAGGVTAGHGIIVDWRTIKSGEEVQTGGDAFATAQLLVALVGPDVAVAALSPFDAPAVAPGRLSSESCEFPLAHQSRPWSTRLVSGDCRRADQEPTTMTTTSTIPALTVGARVRIEKGCAAREVAKNVTAQVTKIEPMGPDYGHSVKVVLLMLNGFKSGKTFVFYARHANRLSDSIIAMNDGNPTHRIEIRRT